jgi:FKBP-type peptidyl-prolyl cis-trans isomerase
VENKSLTETPSGLRYRDELVGSGAEARGGNHVSVHYTGTLESGAKFDSSRDRGKPFEFVLGAGSVIKGWDEGLVGMRVGGRRTLVIPPALGYGARGFPPVIPANATLVFDVELIGIR